MTQTEKFKNLKINDTVYVYNHNTKQIRKGIVMSIIGGNVGNDYKYSSITVGFCTKFNFDKTPFDKGSFAIHFEDGKSKRGVHFTGFIEENDAIEFKNSIIEQEIKEKEDDINQLKKELNQTNKKQ